MSLLDTSWRLSAVTAIWNRSAKSFLRVSEGSEATMRSENRIVLRRMAWTMPSAALPDPITPISYWANIIFVPNGRPGRNLVFPKTAALSVR